MINPLSTKQRGQKESNKESKKMIGMPQLYPFRDDKRPLTYTCGIIPPERGAHEGAPARFVPSLVVHETGLALEGRKGVSCDLWSGREKTAKREIITAAHEIDTANGWSIPCYEPRPRAQRLVSCDTGCHCRHGYTI